MSDLAKMELPNFVKTHCHASFGKDKMVKLKLRINPMQISSYVEEHFVLTEGSVPIEATRIFVGGQPYVIDMKIEEVDEMIENIERGMSIKEG